MTPPAAAAVEVVQVKATPEVVVTAEEVAPTRAAIIEALPEFGNVTGLTAVEAGWHHNLHNTATLWRVG